MRHIHGRAVDCASNCCTLGLAIEKNGKHNKLQIQEIQVSRIDGVRCFEAIACAKETLKPSPDLSSLFLQTALALQYFYYSISTDDCQVSRSFTISRAQLFYCVATMRRVYASMASVQIQRLQGFVADCGPFALLWPELVWPGHHGTRQDIACQPLLPSYAADENDIYILAAFCPILNLLIPTHPAIQSSRLHSLIITVGSLQCLRSALHYLPWRQWRFRSLQPRTGTHLPILRSTSTLCRSLQLRSHFSEYRTKQIETLSPC
jgi:hypothetical protein